MKLQSIPLGGVLPLVASSIALAITLPATAGEPMAVLMGPISITPELSVAEAYDDNIRESGINEEDSWVTTIKPSVTLSAQDRLDLYELNYTANTQIFHSTHENDNTDHHVRAATHTDLNDANRFDLQAQYNKVEELKDTTQIGENDKFHNYIVGGVYGLGAEGALFNLDLGVSNEWLRYDNEGQLNEDRERDVLSFTATGYYAITPILKTLLEVRQHEYDYLLSSSPLNSTSNLYLAGLTWDASELFTGSAKVGYEKKDFDDNSLDDKGNLAWEVAVDWSPITYSTFSLLTRQGIDEGSVTENFIETTNAEVAWKHNWSPYLSHEVSLGRLEEDYDNAIGRKDETDQLEVGLSYEFRRWLTAGVTYRYRDRDSSIQVRNFDSNLYLLNLVVTL